MIRYTLARKSEKQLADWGQAVRVAIPIDTDEDPTDWKAWVRERLEIADGVTIESVEPCTLWVQRTSRAPAGLAGILGTIIDNPKKCASGGIPVAVDAAIVGLAPVERKHEDASKIRWPGKAFRDGTEIFNGSKQSDD